MTSTAKKTSALHLYLVSFPFLPFFESSLLILSFFLAVPSPPFTKYRALCHGLLTSRDETDGAEEACLCVVHLDGQQLVGKSEHQVCEWAEASIVHLRPVEGQPIREGHGVLVGGVPRTDAQDLTGRERKQRFSGQETLSDLKL